MSDIKPTDTLQNQDDKWLVIFVVPFVILFPKYTSLFPEDFSSIAAAGILAGLGGLLGFSTYMFTASRPIWVKMLLLLSLLVPTLLCLRFI